VVEMMKAPSVDRPKPRVRNAGTQWSQVSSRTAITTPATTLTRKAGPTDWSRTPPNQSFRWTAADTTSATAASARHFMVFSFAPADAGADRYP
jgi:hypothetical protein